MKKIGFFLCVLFGLVNIVTAQNKKDLYKKADELANLVYSINNPYEYEPVKIIYTDSIKPKPFNEVKVNYAMQLFKLQKDRVEILANAFSVLYNGIKIELFKPVENVISLCPSLELEAIDSLRFRSKKGLISLATVNYKNVKYIVEISVNDIRLNDRKIKNYGILLVNDFPITHNQDPVKTTSVFNEKAIDKLHQFSGYGRNRSFGVRKRTKDEELMQIASLTSSKEYTTKLQQKSINYLVAWENASGRNIFTISFYIDGIDPNQKQIEAPRGN